MKRTNVDQLLLYRYRYFVGNFLVVAIALVSVCLFLGRLVPGVGQEEALSVPLSLQAIGENPVYAPYKLLQWGSAELLGGTALAARVPSAIFGLLIVGCFYWVLRLWHRPRIAVVGSLLLVTGSWFLHFARLGTPEISLPLAVAALLLAATQFHHSPRWPSLIGLALASVFTLYVPLGIYLLVFTAIALLPDLKRAYESLHIGHAFVGTLLIGLLVVPLARQLPDETVWRSLLGVMNGLPTITEYFRQLFTVVGHVFWRSEPNSLYHLGVLGMLDFFVATMTAIGLYHYEQHFELRRTRLLIGWFFILIAVLALNADQAQYVILLPLIYVFAATGIITLLFQWYQIFPKNPVARVTALVPLCLVLSLSAYYHYSRYFVAWARSPETRLILSSEPTLVRQRLQQLERANVESVVLVAHDDELERFRYVGRDTSMAEAGKYQVTTVDQLTPQLVAANQRVFIASGIRPSKEVRERLKLRRLVVTERSTDSIAFYEYVPVIPKR